MKKIKIDFSQFKLDDSDKKRMKLLDNISIENDPNYKTNKRVNLKYYNADEPNDVDASNYSDCDEYKESEMSNKLEMGIY